MDIHIVGGGFAGIVTGLQFLTRDPEGEHRVTVHERAPEIGTTLCGEGLSEITLGRMRFDGFDHRPFIGATFRGAAWSIPDGKRVVVPDACHTMDRKRWIPAMAEQLERLGGRLETGSELTLGDIRALSADLVVGADGPGSKVRKVMGGEVETRLGIQYRIQDPAIDTDDLLLFHTDKRYSPEYSWVFPRGDDPEHGPMHNVGLLAFEDRRDWERLDRFIQDWAVGGRTVRKEAYPIAFNGTCFERGRHVLIGDAGGMTNPVTKGGMAAVVYASEVLVDRVVAAREGDVTAKGGADDAPGQSLGYERALRAHPILDPSFQRAVEIIKAASNEEVVRWGRFLPEESTVGARGPGVSWGVVVRSLLGNLARAREFATLYRAMGLSRVYSW